MPKAPKDLIKDREIALLGEQNTPEIQFAQGVPLLPNVVPVVILKGSDFEMGYQYTRQLTQIFGKWLLEHDIVHPPISEEQIKVLKTYQSVIKKHTPEMIDFFKGMSAGAKADGISLSSEEAMVQFIDVNASVKENAAFPVDADMEVLESFQEKCSGFAAWASATKNGRMIATGSSDGRDNMSVVTVWYPDNGNRFIYWPFECMGRYLRSGGQPGLNEKGLVLVHHGSTQAVKKETYGLETTLTFFHTLRFADNAKEAVDMQLGYETASGIASGCGGFWADIDGNAFVIESRDPSHIRKSGDLGEVDFMYATNANLAQEVCREGERFIPKAGCINKKKTVSSYDRNLQCWYMLSDYRGEIDIDFLKMMWRYIGEPPPVMVHPDHWAKVATEHWEKTDRAGWAHTVARITNSHIGIVIPDEMLFYAAMGYISSQISPGKPDSMCRKTYIPYQTNSFFQLKLTEKPIDMAKTARHQAEIDLFCAEYELHKLTIHDPAFAPLNEIYNKAIIEWTKGEYLLGNDWGKINWAAEGELVYLLAKAVRAFTRCQSFARQVYNSLKPPASKPEDLGLEPFMGFRGRDESLSVS